MHQHESKLPSSLNKRTLTQTSSTPSTPCARVSRARQEYKQSASDPQREGDADTATDVYYFTQVSIGNV